MVVSYGKKVLIFYENTQKKKLLHLTHLTITK